MAGKRNDYERENFLATIMKKIIRKLVCFIIPERKRQFFEEIVSKIFFPSPGPKDFTSRVSDSCTAMFFGNLFTKTRKLKQ